MWEDILLTGPDGSPRFHHGTGSWNGSRTGREICRGRKRENGKEHTVENIVWVGLGHSRGNGREHSQSVNRPDGGRDRAGRWWYMQIGIFRNTTVRNEGWRQRVKRGKWIESYYWKGKNITITSTAVCSINFGLILTFGSCLCGISNFLTSQILERQIKCGRRLWNRVNQTVAIKQGKESALQYCIREHN